MLQENRMMLKFARLRKLSCKEWHSPGPAPWLERPQTIALQRKRQWESLQGGQKAPHRHQQYQDRLWFGEASNVSQIQDWQNFPVPGLWQWGKGLQKGLSSSVYIQFCHRIHTENQRSVCSDFLLACVSLSMPSVKNFKAIILKSHIPFATNHFTELQ